MYIAVAVLAVSGIFVLSLGALGALGRLERNSWVGVRTATTLRDPGAFALAQKVAAPSYLLAGLLLLLAGAFLLADAPGAAQVMVVAVAVPAALLMLTVGGNLGARAAHNRVAAAPGCAGGCASCGVSTQAVKPFPADAAACASPS